MATQLRMYWDGETPGLREGRMSLVAFGPALVALVKAAKNIAARHVAAAVGEEYDSHRATKRVLVDVQLSTYVAGSADLTADVVGVPSHMGAAALIPDLAERVVRELLESIRDEVAGRTRDRYVNEYLHALPDGLRKQRYSAVVDGREMSVVEVESMDLADPVTATPALALVRGVVAGVNFGEPLRPEIRFAPYEGQLLTLGATKEQVQAAVSLDGVSAKAMVLLGRRNQRVLWIRRDDEPATSLSVEQQQDHIFSRWRSTLSRLAK